MSANRYERNLVNVMDLRVDANGDKRKINDNENGLYDVLFNRNIGNHKIIAKYLHGCGRLVEKIMKDRRQPQRRNLSQHKLGKKLIVGSDTTEIARMTASRAKLARPKTSKNSVKKGTTLKGSTLRT